MIHLVALTLATTFSPVQSIVWNAGAAHAYKVVLDRARVGSSSPVQYQYRLTVYGSDANGKPYIAYRSPGRDSFLAKVVKPAPNAPAFPSQTATIVGVARTTKDGAPVVVVQRYEAAADCGDSQVALFAARAGAIRKVAGIQNPCDLSARILHRGARDEVELSGPYYRASDALCCPSKPRVRAQLMVGPNGRWVVRPRLFRAL